MSDTPEKIGGMKLLTVDEMRERFPLPSTPETDAFYGELHPEQGLLEHARSLERRLRETQAELESARTALFSEGARSGAAKAERDAALRELEELKKWLANNTTWCP